MIGTVRVSIEGGPLASNMLELRAGAVEGADESTVDIEHDPEDTIIQWSVYLDGEYLGIAQGTLVEVIPEMFSYAGDVLSKPQAYLQARDRMGTDDEEPPEPPPSIESLFM